jgi:AAA15 family ATPase/GTPase
MICSFSIGNYLSFKEVHTINFEPAALKEPTDSIYFHTSGEYKLLKSVSIYGSNSSGKSNLLKGFAFMKSLVVNSFSDSNRSRNIAVKPYLLEKGYDVRNSFFQVTFYVDNIKYRYGFEINSNSIKEEWLFYSEPKKREQHYFVRKEQDIGCNNAWKKSSTIKIDPIVSYVKPNVLFVSVLSQFNIEIGTIVIDWFNKNLIGFDFNDEYYINKTAQLLENDEYFLAIHSLIKQAKLGFESVEQKVIGDYQISEKFSNPFMDFVLSDSMNEYSISTKHKIYNDKKKVIGNIDFDLFNMESEGTQKFFGFAGALLTAIKNKQILWVDELDSKFHSLLFETIVRFFNSNKFNHRGAQMIFTSHNTHLLKENILRRDQIYTITKNQFGESAINGKLVSKIRIDASHEKEYFSGSLGGIEKINLDGLQLDLF